MIDGLVADALCEVISETVAEIKERKINKCVIEFENNPAKIYYSGQLVHGIVHLHLFEKVRSVFVKIIGKAYVRWNVSSGNNATESRGREIFLDERVSPIRESTDKLLPGSYKYSFQYKLPEVLPSSLEYTYGCIRYKACVVIENLFFPNEKLEESFSVIGVAKLDSYTLEPVISTNHKTFYLSGFLCCVSSEALETVAEISASGFLPRQTIHLHLHVNNRSNQPVLEFIVQLIQKIKYLTEAKSLENKTNKIILKQDITRGCDSGTEEDIYVRMVIPTVPPNQNSICSLIKIKYFLRIIGSVPCFHSDLELSFPIHIGSIPIEDKPALPSWMSSIANDF